jgi:pilus assembly protein CpaB
MALMVIAIGCGLVASYMTSKLIADRNNNQQSEERVSVVVAKKRVNKWILIKKPEDMFELRDYPRELVQPKTIRDLAFLKDKRLGETVKEGAVVTEDQVLNKDIDGLAALVNPGSRAVAIRVNAESLVGGFVLPGSLVDIVCTQNRGEVVSMIILQGMTVLAVDQQSDRKSESGTGISIIGSTVTLAALPEESTRLRLAQAVGDLSLLLRSAGDNTPLQRPPVSKPSDLLRPLRDPKETEPDERVAESKTSPMTPDVPLPPDAKHETKPESVDERALMKHKLTIIDGPYTQEVQFVWDEDAKRWRAASAADLEDRPRTTTPKPAPTPTPGPEAPVTPKGPKDPPKETGPGSTRPPSTRVPSTRTG